MKVGETIWNSPQTIGDMIVETFTRYHIPLNEVTCVIMGGPGPTGKTWLCDYLKQRGINAAELIVNRRLSFDIKYLDDNNHCVMSIEDRSATVVLNERIDKYFNK